MDKNKLPFNQNCFDKFSTLFVFKDRIKEAGIYDSLNLQNRIALDIAKSITSRDTSGMQRISAQHRQTTRSTLEWILKTGYDDDGLSNEYSEILDIVSILLIRKYKNRTCLPLIAEMIFKRHNRGAFIHNLTWAFFEDCDPYSLILIAKYLYSDSYDDIELACKLLNFVPGLNTENSSNYFCFLRWFNENCPFLYYTGESFQQKPNPMAYTVCVEAKYLCKAVCAVSGEMVESLSKDEEKLMNRFNNLDDSKKVLLSDYSYRLHCHYPGRWNEWIRYPVTEQVKIAQTGIEGML